MEAIVAPDATECGGAVLPGIAFPTWTVQIKHPRLTEDQLYDVLLARGVVARRAQGTVILDFRSVLPSRIPFCSTPSPDRTRESLRKAIYEWRLE